MIYRQILAHNRLEKPDGRPLFRYRVPERLLNPLDLEIRSGLKGTPTWEGAPLFCLWASRKLRSLSEDLPGNLSWNQLGLGREFPRSLLVGWADLGLERLKRPIAKNVSDAHLRLHTLFLEGGVPLRQLQRDLWTQVKTLFTSFRPLGTGATLAHIHGRVTESLPDLPPLKLQALTIFLRGLVQLDQDVSFQRSLPSNWDEATVAKASSLLNVELPSDLAWLDALLRETPRETRRRTCGGLWLVEGVHSGDVKLLFQPDLPRRLSQGELTADVWLHLVSDGKRTFVGRYEKTGEGPLLQDQRPVEFEPSKSWNSVRLLAEDEDDEPVRSPVQLKGFETPSFPLVARRADLSATRWLVVPANWKLVQEGQALLPRGSWLVAPFEPSVQIFDPDGQLFAVPEREAKPIPPLEGWESLEGVLFAGKPVRTKLPREITGWVKDRTEGLVTFRFLDAEGRTKSRQQEVVLPGLSVEGRVYPAATAQELAKVLWTVRLPSPWHFAETARDQGDEKGVFKFRTDFRQDHGDEAGERFLVTDGLQTLTLTAFASPQLFLCETANAPLLQVHESTVWEQDLVDRWWLFKTKRVRDLVVNDEAFDLDVPEDVSSRPGQLLLRSFSDRLPVQPHPTDPLRSFRQLRLLVRSKTVVHAAGYHEELQITIESHAIGLARSALFPLGEGLKVRINAEGLSQREQPPVLQVLALWNPKAEPLVLAQEADTYWLPDGWQNYPEGMYLLYCEAQPNWFRPALFPLNSGRTYVGDLSPMQRIAHGEELAERLKALPAGEDNFYNLSLKAYSELFQTLRNDPDSPEWLTLWHTLGRFVAFGTEFLFQIKVLRELLQTPGEASVSGFLGLLWAVRAGFLATGEADLPAHRLNRLLNKTERPVFVDFKLKHLATNSQLAGAFVQAVDLLPETWVEGQTSLKEVLAVVRPEAHP